MESKFTGSENQIRILVILILLVASAILFGFTGFLVALIILGLFMIPFVYIANYENVEEFFMGALIGIAFLPLMAYILAPLFSLDTSLVIIFSTMLLVFMLFLKRKRKLKEGGASPYQLTTPDNSAPLSNKLEEQK